MPFRLSFIVPYEKKGGGRSMRGPDVFLRSYVRRRSAGDKLKKPLPNPEGEVEEFKEPMPRPNDTADVATNKRRFAEANPSGFVHQGKYVERVHDVGG